MASTSAVVYLLTRALAGTSITFDAGGNVAVIAHTGTGVFVSAEYVKGTAPNLLVDTIGGIISALVAGGTPAFPPGTRPVASDPFTVPIPPPPPATPPRLLDAHDDHFGTYNLFGGTQGPYWLNQNAWNLGGLAPLDYAQTIKAFPDTFPNATVFAWSYPATPNSGNVWSYPELIYGSQAGGGFIVPAHTPPAKTINSFNNLSVTYNISLTISTPDDTDVLIETWVQTIPGNQGSNVNEVAFYAYAPGGNVGQTLGFPNHFNYSDGTFNAYVGATSNFSFVGVLPVTTPGGTTPLDMSAGTQTIPILSVMQAMVVNGYISGANFISGFEFGFEVSRNSGGATINSIAWTWD